jgi:hypothetical protein
LTSLRQYLAMTTKGLSDLVRHRNFIRSSFQSPLQSPSLSRTDRRTVMSGRASGKLTSNAIKFLCRLRYGFSEFNFLV